MSWACTGLGPPNSRGWVSGRPGFRARNTADSTGPRRGRGARSLIPSGWISTRGTAVGIGTDLKHVGAQHALLALPAANGPSGVRTRSSSTIADPAKRSRIPLDTLLALTMLALTRFVNRERDALSIVRPRWGWSGRLRRTTGSVRASAPGAESARMQRAARHAAGRAADRAATTARMIVEAFGPGALARRRMRERIGAAVRAVATHLSAPASFWDLAHAAARHLRLAVDDECLDVALRGDGPCLRSAREQVLRPELTRRGNRSRRPGPSPYLG
jgi:hypothetical protein